MQRFLNEFFSSNEKSIANEIAYKVMDLAKLESIPQRTTIIDQLTSAIKQAIKYEEYQKLDTQAQESACKIIASHLYEHTKPAFFNSYLFSWNTSLLAEHISLALKEGNLPANLRKRDSQNYIIGEFVINALLKMMPDTKSISADDLCIYIYKIASDSWYMDDQKLRQLSKDMRCDALTSIAKKIYQKHKEKSLTWIIETGDFSVSNLSALPINLVCREFYDDCVSVLESKEIEVYLQPKVGEDLHQIFNTSGMIKLIASYCAKPPIYNVTIKTNRAGPEEKISVTNFETIGQIKNKIQEHTGTPLNDLRLFYNSGLLQHFKHDHHTIDDYSIPPNTVLICAGPQPRVRRLKLQAR
jgi:hypothetical protein